MTAKLENNTSNAAKLRAMVRESSTELLLETCDRTEAVAHSEGDEHSGERFLFSLVAFELSTRLELDVAEMVMFMRLGERATDQFRAKHEGRGCR